MQKQAALGAKKTPRMWGWTALERATAAGFNRKPHVCGDGPTKALKLQSMSLKTPRMWGWTDD